MELRLQQVSVAEVVAQVASTVETLAAQKQIHVETAAENAGQILADESKGRQIILNLASNAITFAPESERVTIRATQFSGRRVSAAAYNPIQITHTDV